jgi:hypothetical protein
LTLCRLAIRAAAPPAAIAAPKSSRGNVTGNYPNGSVQIGLMSFFEVDHLYDR